VANENAQKQNYDLAAETLPAFTISRNGSSWRDRRLHGRRARRDFVRPWWMECSRWVELVSGGPLNGCSAGHVGCRIWGFSAGQRTEYDGDRTRQAVTTTACRRSCIPTPLTSARPRCRTRVRDSTATLPRTIFDSARNQVRQERRSRLRQGTPARRQKCGRDSRSRSST